MPLQCLQLALLWHMTCFLPEAASAAAEENSKRLARSGQPASHSDGLCMATKSRFYDQSRQAKG